MCKQECIVPWLKCNSTCPVCRAKITSDEVKQCTTARQLAQRRGSALLLLPTRELQRQLDSGGVAYDVDTSTLDSNKGKLVQLVLEMQERQLASGEPAAEACEECTSSIESAGAESSAIVNGTDELDSGQ